MAYLYIMKKLILILFCFLGFCSVKSQSDTVSEISSIKSGDGEAFILVSEMPQFPGGMTALYKFIGGKITYPEKAKEKGIQGKCFIKFVVKKNGKVGKIEVQQGVEGCPECDKEAVKAVKALPNFIPGKNEGKPVAVWFQLPINFKLTD